MDKNVDNEYVVVTTLSTFRIRYVVPRSELQKCNPPVPVKPHEWAKDSVTCGDLDEFSQEHIGEEIIDVWTEDLSRVLQRYDEENEYLADLDRDVKIHNIMNPWLDGHEPKTDLDGGVPFEKNHPVSDIVNASEKREPYWDYMARRLKEEGL